MVTVCNNKLCKNREKPCRLGCIQKGFGHYCAGCDSNVCPWGNHFDIVPITAVRCKGGKYETAYSRVQVWNR